MTFSRDLRVNRTGCVCACARWIAFSDDPIKVLFCVCVCARVGGLCFLIFSSSFLLSPFLFCYARFEMADLV